MIKSVVYRKANMSFLIEDGLLDGNFTFDNIEVSDILKAVIRFNHGSLWYKFYDHENIGISERNKDMEELDKVVVSFIEKRLSRSLRGLTFEELLKNEVHFEVLKDGLILVVSQIFNKRKACIIIDFCKKECSLDYYWPCEDQEYTVKTMLANIIKIGLGTNVHFGKEVVIRDITVDIEFDDEFPRLDLLSDLVMCDNLLKGEFKLCEKHRPRSLRSKYILRMDLSPNYSSQNSKVHEQQVMLLFINHKSLLIRANGLQDKYLVPEIEKKVAFLMQRYNEKKCELASIYDGLLGVPSSDSFRYSREKLAEIKGLRRRVPDLFIAGYSRECSVKPFIVSEKQAEELESEGRKTIRYPKEGPYSYIYACPKNYYPGLKINRLANSSKFTYLPVCYLTDHSLNPNSNYNSYYYNRPYNETTLVVEDNQQLEEDSILSKGEYGVIPGVLKKILVRNDEHALKIGSPKHKSSCLYCIHSYMGRNLTESAITNIRKTLEFNPNICLQELWYMDPEEIISTARNPDIFLDPTLYVRALESIYCLNIYVFDVNKKHDVKLSIAKCPLPYIWEPIQGKSIAILCHRDASDFPHCEYIKLDKVQSARLKAYKSDYLTLVKGTSLKNPLISLVETHGEFSLLSQQINEDGKCDSITIKKSDETRTITEQCFWRPLNLPIKEHPENAINIKDNIRKREMAYFLCDIASILKKLEQDNVSIISNYFETSQKESVFEPFIIREKFENTDECISYYSTKLPSIFKNSKIVVNEKIYLQLMKFASSFSYTRLFSRVVKPRHFIRKSNTTVLIRKR
jgi:hypothetical protein